jgi:hypothetical protein
MHGKIERTILGIDVMNVEMRFDEETAARLRALVSGRKFSESLADSIVAVVLETRSALVTIDIEYDIDIPRFLEESRRNLRASAAAGLVPRGVADEVVRNMGPWFEFLNSRGLKKGDRLAYRILGESVRSQVIIRGGQLLLDQTDPAGGERRLATLAGYLAPGTDLRDQLVRSLFAE